jgi:hypothetical protein
MIPKAYKIKYSKEIETLKSLSLSDDNIVSILQKKEDFDGWVPITFEELKKMSPEKLKELKSYCWKDGNPRCDCIGNLRSVEFNEEAEDFLIQIDQADLEYEIEVVFAETLAKGSQTVVVEGTSLDDISHPFPAAGKFGPNITFLDKPVDEGLYTVVYRSNGRSDYNASMWRET